MIATAIIKRIACEVSLISVISPCHYGKASESGKVQTKNLLLPTIRNEEIRMNPVLKQKIAFALLMGIVTTGIISFTLIGLNVGFGQHFWKTWLRSWGIGYVVVVPAILLIGPRIQSMVNRIVKA